MFEYIPSLLKLYKNFVWKRRPKWRSLFTDNLDPIIFLSVFFSESVYGFHKNVMNQRVLFLSIFQECWCLFTSIVVHQLWSSAFSRKHEAWVVAGNWGRVCQYHGNIPRFFLATGMVPPRVGSRLKPHTLHIRSGGSDCYRPWYRTDRTARAL